MLMLLMRMVVVVVVVLMLAHIGCLCTIGDVRGSAAAASVDLPSRNVFAAAADASDASAVHQAQRVSASALQCRSFLFFLSLFRRSVGWFFLFHSLPPFSLSFFLSFSGSPKILSDFCCLLFFFCSSIPFFSLSLELSVSVCLCMMLPPVQIDSTTTLPCSMDSLSLTHSFSHSIPSLPLSRSSPTTATAAQLVPLAAPNCTAQNQPLC